MTFARSAALVARLFGRLPGVMPTVHAATLGGLMALGGAAGANAAVVTSPVANQLIPVTIDGIYINVVTGALGTTASAVPGWDLNPWGSSTLFIYYGTGGGVVLTAAGGQVANLATGTVVGPATTAFGQTSVATTGSGAWTLNSTDYFGFRFIGDDTFLHYGYGSVIIGTAFNAPTRMIGNLWYESAANTAITVSPAAAVPESSNVAMLLAGGAALAAMALRRRRQADA